MKKSCANCKHDYKVWDTKNGPTMCSECVSGRGGWQPREQPKPERPQKDCHLCRYENRSNGKYPCKDCLQSDCRVWLEKKDSQASKDRLIMRQAIETYGRGAQVLKGFEELGELISAVARGNTENITEELADVGIMCEQVGMMFEITPEQVEGKRQEKLKRLKDRLEGKE